MDSLIPTSKISNLTQGMFVGAASDNFDERIEQKIFHAEIVVDSVKVSAEMKVYEKIPVITEFTETVVGTIFFVKLLKTITVGLSRRLLLCLNLKRNVLRLIRN